MKIKDLQFKVVEIPLIKPFKIAFSVQDRLRTVILRMETESGLVGYGEASPSQRVTGESVEHVLATLNALKPNLIGEDAASIARLHYLMDSVIKNNTAAKAAVDIAAYDILGQRANLPLYRLLGGYSKQIESDMTIGIADPETMIEDAKLQVERGFRTLKIKCGANPSDDLFVVKSIRQAVGPKIRIRLDANQGWDFATADYILRGLADQNIQLVEQPLRDDDFTGLKELRLSHDIPIAADETVKTSFDASRVAANRCADLVNIKLMKAGGIYRAMQINSICEAANIQCMVGCMVESVIGISAAASLVAAQANITEADVDSVLYFKEVPELKGGISFSGGDVILSDKPGLGVDVSIF